MSLLQWSLQLMKGYLTRRNIQTQKVWSKSCVSPMIGGLDCSSHSPARSHYCPTRPVWAALCPAWPGSRLLRPPGHPGLPPGDHVDAGLSADADSTWPATPSVAPPTRCPHTQPSRSRVTETRHSPRHDQWGHNTWCVPTIRWSEDTGQSGNRDGHQPTNSSEAETSLLATTRETSITLINRCLPMDRAPHHKVPLGWINH